MGIYTPTSCSSSLEGHIAWGLDVLIREQTTMSLFASFQTGLGATLQFFPSHGGHREVVLDVGGRAECVGKPLWNMRPAA